MSVGAYASLAHEAIDELVDAHGTRRREWRHRPLPAGRARRPRRAAAAGRRSARANRWPRSSSDPAAAHERLATSIRARRPRCTRTTRVGSCAPSSSAEAGESLVPRRRPALGERDPPSDADRGARRSGRTSSSGGSWPGPTPCSRQGVVEEVQAALAGRRLADRRQGARSRGDRDPARGRGARAHRHPHPPLRRLPAEVDAPDPRPRQRGRHPGPGGRLPPSY